MLITKGLAGNETKLGTRCAKLLVNANKADVQPFGTTP